MTNLGHEVERELSGTAAPKTRRQLARELLQAYEELNRAKQKMDEMLPEFRLLFGLERNVDNATIRLIARALVEDEA